MSIRSDRKEEHLALAQMFFHNHQKNSFDQMQLLRPALPETSVAKVDLRVEMFNKTLAAPFFINAMTGGSAKSKKINQELGEIAARENIAMALGSASILVKEPEQFDSFYVARAANPDGVVIANLNPATPASVAAKIVNELEADALQIHLNVLQEIAMPEGDRDFYWLDNLMEIRQQVDKPIIIKEVGAGLDYSSILRLKKAGFTWFDVAGAGGTNFAEIENSRNPEDQSYLEEIGLPTVLAAKMAKLTNTNFIVSGGVRNPLDVFKGLVLGGKYVGISNGFLQLLEEGKLATAIPQWKEELRRLYALFGVEKTAECQNCGYYLDLPLLAAWQQIEQELGL